MLVLIFTVNGGWERGGTSPPPDGLSYSKFTFLVDVESSLSHRAVDRRFMKLKKLKCSRDNRHADDDVHR
jgi:hypothetical protein